MWMVRACIGALLAPRTSGGPARERGQYSARKHFRERGPPAKIAANCHGIRRDYPRAQTGGTPELPARAKNARPRGVHAVAVGSKRCALSNRAFVRVAVMRAPRDRRNDDHTSTTRFVESPVVGRSTQRCGLGPSKERLGDPSPSLSSIAPDALHPGKVAGVKSGRLCPPRTPVGSR